MKPLLFTLALIQCATLAYYLRPEPKTQPPKPREVYYYPAPDSVYSEKQILLYDEYWER